MENFRKLFMEQAKNLQKFYAENWRYFPILFEKTL